jgi:hypothetical protein
MPEADFRSCALRLQPDDAVAVLLKPLAAGTVLRDGAERIVALYPAFAVLCVLCVSAVNKARPAGPRLACARDCEYS